MTHFTRLEVMRACKGGNQVVATRDLGSGLRAQLRCTRQGVPTVDLVLSEWSVDRVVSRVAWSGVPERLEAQIRRYQS